MHVHKLSGWGVKERMKEIVGKSILILGYGREGQSVHRYLVEHFPHLTIGIADKISVKPILNDNVALHTGGAYLEALSQYDTVVRSPGVPPFLSEFFAYQKHGGHTSSATNIFFSVCPGKIIGVTGTKGKSTTASLIAEILKTTYADVRLVGNIGQPALDFLEGSDQDTIFVAELSSHQLADIRYSPQVAVILAIVPEHFDYYPDLASYAAAKGNIVARQSTNDIVVFNPSNALADKQAKRSRGKKLMYGLKQRDRAIAFIEKKAIVTNAYGVKEEILPVSEIPLLGNLDNVLAAVAVGIAFDVPVPLMRGAIGAFHPLPHRLEFVGEFRRIRFYNDSLSTIPEATIHALEALGSDVATLIAGGYDRGLDFTKLGEYLVKTSIKTLILFPPTGEKIWKAVKQATQATPATPARPEIHKFDVKTMKEAVRLAYQHTPPGKICLLSPASASFNLFRDYEDRGNQFKEWVKKLGD